MEITGTRDDKSAIFKKKLVFVLVLKKGGYLKRHLNLVNYRSNVKCMINVLFGFVINIWRF